MGYSRLNLASKTEDEKEVKTVFTHSRDEDGWIIKSDHLRQEWDNVRLLPIKLRTLDQFLVWNNKSSDYFILLGKAGSEFK